MNQLKQRLARSLHLSRSQPEARYFQLATVDERGYPDNRTLVFRGFDPDSDGLLAITDLRSDKVAHLLGNNRVSLAWYFAKTREQFRFRGEAIVRVTSVDELKRCHPVFEGQSSVEVSDTQTLWSQLSASAKAQFYWPVPRAPIGEGDIDNAVTEPSPFFAVICVQPESAEYLDLKPSPQCREVYQLSNGQWACQSVNP